MKQTISVGFFHRRVIAFTNPGSQDAAYVGYIYAFLLFATAFAQSILVHQYFHKTFVIGMRLRTALVSAIYKKSLLLSNAARRSSTVGEITNLMAVDAQKFMDMMSILNMVWSAPLQVSYSVYGVPHFRVISC